MKRILIFQTASFGFMKKILNNIMVSGNSVLCVKYSKCDTTYEKLFPDINFICVDDIISYNSNRGLNIDIYGICFDEIYVPSSTPYFFGFNEVFSFISDLEYKYMILYDCYENTKIYKKKNIVFREFEYAVTWTMSKVYEIMYRLKCMTCRE